MPKLFGKAIIGSFMFVFLFPHVVYCEEQYIEKFITEFYTWYIHLNSTMDVTKHKDIYHYVAKETVEGINKTPQMPGFDGTDYFLKLDDTPPSMKGVSILVNQVETLGPDTFSSIVTIVYIDEFGHRFPDSIIVVILKKIEGSLKIFKCMDIYPEA